MSASASETKIKPSASRRVRLVAAALLALALVAFSGVVLRDEDLKPMDDLAPLSPASPETNGFLRLLSGWEGVPDAVDADHEHWRRVLNGKEPWDAELALRLTAGREDPLSEAREALSLPDWQWSVSHGNTGKAYSAMTTAFQAGALIAAHRGETRKALETLRVFLELQRRTLAGTIIVGTVNSSFAHSTRMLLSVPYLMANEKDSPENDQAWAAVQEAWLRLEITPENLDEVLRGQASLDLQAMRNGTWNPYGVAAWRRLFYKRNKAHNRVADVYHSAFGGWLRPVPSREDSPWVRYDWEDERNPPAKSMESRAVREAMKTVAYMDDLARYGNALSRLTAVRIALHRCHLRLGGPPPKRLETLVPEFLKEVPPDPYDGKPLRWDSQTGVLYSIGRDWNEAPPSFGGRGWFVGDREKGPGLRLAIPPPDGSDPEDLPDIR